MKRALATIAGIAALALTPVAADATPRAVLSAVNYEREMAGLPPLTSRPDLAEACEAHTAYMERNSILTHGENAGSPLFSDRGLWAGAHSVLARSTAGFSGNPWRSAPFHQFQVLHPWLAETGVSITGGYACMITLGDRDAPNPDSIGLLTIPGTAQYVRPAEVARESPFTPGDEVGIPQGTKTGPHIYVYAQGPQRFTTVSVQSASLTAADGSQVPLRWVDGNSPRSGRYLDGGAILIPTTPLQENTSYGLRVEAATTSASGSRLLMSRTSTFLTGPDEFGLVQAPQASDTITAASTRGSGTSTKKRKTTKLKKGAPAIIGGEGQPTLEVALRWTPSGIRAKIHCRSEVSRCEGPLRILVKRKGRKTQKLRFVARGGPLKLSLSPGRTISRRLKMTDRQRASGRKRGFAVRWGTPAPEKARALEIQ